MAPGRRHPTPVPPRGPRPRPPPGPTRRVPWWVALLIGIGAFIAGAIASAVVVIAVGTALGGGGAEVATAGPAGELSVPEAAVGTCFTGVVKGSTFDRAVVEKVGEPVGCDAGHHLELYGSTAVAMAPGAAYRRDELSWFADDLCALLFDDYVSAAYADSVWDYLAVIPSRPAWDGGSRTVSCLIFDVDGARVTNSARGSGV